MPRPLSHKLDDILHFCRGRKEMTVGDFLDHQGPSGPAVLTMIFSIPFLFFAWVPVLMRIFGFIILISGIRIAMNKPIWVPKKVRRCHISGNKVAHRLVFWIKLLKKVEKVIHPRGTIYQQSPFLQTFNGFIVSLCGLFLFLPFSSLSNFLPALGVFILSVGILEEDLWVMIAAYVVLIVRVLALFAPIYVR